MMLCCVLGMSKSGFKKKKNDFLSKIKGLLGMGCGRTFDSWMGIGDPGLIWEILWRIHKFCDIGFNLGRFVVKNFLFWLFGVEIKIGSSSQD